MRPLPAQKPLVPELAKQARERRAIHAELPGHLFPGNGEQEILCALRAEVKRQPLPPIRNGQTLDVPLQSPIFFRNLAEQIFQQPRTVLAAARRAERKQRRKREKKTRLSAAVRSSTGCRPSART